MVYFLFMEFQYPRHVQKLKEIFKDFITRMISLHLYFQLNNSISINFFIQFLVFPFKKNITFDKVSITLLQFFSKLLSQV